MIMGHMPHPLRFPSRTNQRHCWWAGTNQRLLFMKKLNVHNFAVWKSYPCPGKPKTFCSLGQFPGCPSFSWHTNTACIRVYSICRFILFLCVGLFSVQLSVTLCPVSQVRGRLFVCDLLKVPTCTKLLKSYSWSCFPICFVFLYFSCLDLLPWF